MKKNIWWLMVVIVFVAGLLVSSMLVQAKEKEKEKEKVTEVQWEYKIVDATYKKEKNVKHRVSRNLSMLNEHGKDGWELCGVNNINYYFKREIRE